jgi:paired amphipathic helix protein Sin3a
MYSRLLICKEIGAHMAREKHASLFANPVAVELGLDEPNGPSVVLAQAIESVGDTAGGSPNVLYMYFLDACEKVFANELDQSTFEEHMRWFFRTKVSPRNFWW